MAAIFSQKHDGRGYWTNVSIYTKVWIGHLGAEWCILNSTGAPFSILWGICDEKDHGSYSFCWLRARPNTSRLRLLQQHRRRVSGVAPIHKRWIAVWPQGHTRCESRSASGPPPAPG